VMGIDTPFSGLGYVLYSVDKAHPWQVHEGYNIG
jgi:hypothetical protein